MKACTGACHVEGDALMVRTAEMTAYIMLFAVSFLKQCSGMAART